MDPTAKTDRPFVNLQRSDSIAWLTLDRPERRNALGEEILVSLNGALSELRDDETARVVVLTGTAPVFCAGAESKVKSNSWDDERRTAFAGRKSAFRRLFERSTILLEGLEQITIAMINGHAIGAGWGLALACDFRVSSSKAQFWIPEIDLGVLLGVGSTTRLVRAVGPIRAKEIILGGGKYSAEQLKELGLVTRVAPPDALLEETKAMANTFAAKPFAPLSQMKARINAIAENAVPAVDVATQHFLTR